MKIAVAQVNPIVNDFEGNKLLITKLIQSAKENGANLVVFPELSVCGYPPHDLLDRSDFIEKCLNTVREIALNCNEIFAIVGAPAPNSASEGKLLFNSAYLLGNGEIISVHHKALLPTYDIFDEYRYFEPNTEFKVAEICGKRIAITVCEDLWDDQPLSSAVRRSKLYKVSPMEALAKQKPELVINIAASPFSSDNYQRRLEVFKGTTHRFGLPVIYVNQVGANTDLIFDGGSMVLNGKGNVVLQLKRFEEDFKIVDTDSIKSLPSIIHSTQNDRIALIHKALVLGIADYFRKMGFKKATLGLSGGIDSAVVLCLAQEALGSENLRVLLLPSQYSSDHSITDAIKLAENIKVKYDIISIENAFSEFNNSLSTLFAGLPQNLAEENIQARVRAVMLMALSNKFGHLLLNTSNKSEAAVGYGTLYGDMCGALSVLGDVYKTDVYALAHYINREKEIIPLNSIIKPPSAELRPDQKDSDSLPEYDILDKILFKYIEEGKSEETIVAEGFDLATVRRTIKLVNNNEYKRFQCPPILRVSSKAFGFGRKMPLVAKF
jgi:NAD+ synthase (glutamine-hydrolysing)